jgi:hypothetical protein
MPILHRCGFPTCATFTLGIYCYEHERLVRAEHEAERRQAAARDERIARELAALSPATVPQDLPPAA